MNDNSMTLWSEEIDKVVARREGYSWSAFFKSIQLLVNLKDDSICRIIDLFSESKSNNSVFHCITLLGMAVKYISNKHNDKRIMFENSDGHFTSSETMSSFLSDYSDDLKDILIKRQNSFTSARRFLLPQILFPRFFKRHCVDVVNFCDLGTGAGVLPLQLNDESLYHKYIIDLVWEGFDSTFNKIPLNNTCGIDNLVLPNMDWVMNCFGDSEYYRERLQELNNTITEEKLDIIPLDITSSNLGEFISYKNINAITCNFVLYQYDEEIRNNIINMIVNTLSHPGILICVDPNPDFKSSACEVKVYTTFERSFYNFISISNSHYIGKVTNGADFDRFVNYNL